MLTPGAIDDLGTAISRLLKVANLHEEETRLLTLTRTGFNSEIDAVIVFTKSTDTSNCESSRELIIIYISLLLIEGR